MTTVSITIIATTISVINKVQLYHHMDQGKKEDKLIALTNTPYPNKATNNKVRDSICS